MGNCRFRLSDMMPNAWFYKLKGMNRATNNRSSTQTPKKIHQHPQKMRPATHIPSRASYYFPSDSPLLPKALDTHPPLHPPRKPTRKPRKKPVSPSGRFDRSDIVFDVGAELDLPPIIPKKPPAEPKKAASKASSQRQCSMRRLRMRANTPRTIANSKQSKSLSESFAVVKDSSDPEKDFRESMMEMIVENNLRAPQDLEELLACYLSLNSNECHDVIVKVFEEIWFDIN